MGRVTTITDPDGRVTTIRSRSSSGCGGCLTALAVIVALFGPAAWFPRPLEIAAYVVLAVLVIAGAIGWLTRRRVTGG